MSVKTNIKTELADKEILAESLKKLDVNFTVHADEKANILDYYKKDASNKGVITISKYVGFERTEDGALALVGDTHYENGLFKNAKTAVDKVTQVYQATKIALAIEESGTMAIDYENSNLDAHADEMVVVAQFNN